MHGALDVCNAVMEVAVSSAIRPATTRGYVPHAPCSCMLEKISVISTDLPSRIPLKLLYLLICQGRLLPDHQYIYDAAPHRGSRERSLSFSAQCPAAASSARHQRSSASSLPSTHVHAQGAAALGASVGSVACAARGGGRGRRQADGQADAREVGE